MSRMNLGEQIIDELGRRGRRGMYFSFDAYKRLHIVTNQDQLKNFLTSERFEDAPYASDVTEIVDYLHKATASITQEDVIFLFALALIGKFDHALDGLVFYYFFYIGLRRKPPRRIIRWPWSQTSSLTSTAK